VQLELEMQTTAALDPLENQLAFLDAVEAAVAQHTQDGDKAFRELVFGRSASIEPPEVSIRVANTLREGFQKSGGTTQGITCSFALLCFLHARIDLLREVLDAKHPAAVAGVPTESRKDWMQQLNMRRYDPSYSRTSLVRMAIVGARPPHSADFLELALEVDPDDAHARDALLKDGPGPALVREAVMRMQIRKGRAAGQYAIENVTPRRRTQSV
jgi:hypothetical protein